MTDNPTAALAAASGHTEADAADIVQRLRVAGWAISPVRNPPGVGSEKPFLLFQGRDYYPDGGWDDYVGSFATVDAAKSAPQEIDESGSWLQIVDARTRAVVLTATLYKHTDGSHNSEEPFTDAQSGADDDPAPLLRKLKTISQEIVRMTQEDLDEVMSIQSQLEQLEQLAQRELPP